MAQKFSARPSEILRLEDGYAAFCFDEACCWISAQLEEGKRPFFGREREDGAAPCAAVNAATVSILKNLGAEVIHID